MANKNLFPSLVGRLVPAANTVNEAGGKAYAMSPRHALAQYAATGCLNHTFYANAETQLEEVLRLVDAVPSAFVAKTAVYARERGNMKDMPALLCAALTNAEPPHFEEAFDHAIDNGRMLRTFAQIVRSGATGRKSFGSRPRRKLREWLDARTDEALFADSVGADPSIADIVKMVHPKPKSEARRALYGYLIGKPVDESLLPELVQGFEAYRRKERETPPPVPFQMLTSLELRKEDWKDIARNGKWQMTRMNLNTFARHGVFEDPGVTAMIASRLRDPDLVAKARAFPYQLLSAYVAAGDVPAAVREALQDAMEHATRNVPAVRGKVYIATDVSGSMTSPVTGYRKGATTAVRCIDVAGLFAASILRKNPEAEVLPFAETVKDVALNPRDSVMTNAERLAALGGGGTNCSAALAALNQRKAKGDLVIFVSDNQSWMDPEEGRGTATLNEWNRFQKRNPEARLVLIDIQPFATTQAGDREDILNVGGFSDEVFNVVSAFAEGKLAEDHWISEIEAIELGKET